MYIVKSETAFSTFATYYRKYFQLGLKYFY